MIIGLLGRSRVGKDTVARALVAALSGGGHAATVLRLATPLKEAVRALYGFTEEQMETDAKEVVDPRYGLTPRVAIQRLCGYMMNAHGIDFFTRRLWAGAGGAAGGAVVIPDVRYAHDVAEIRRRGGIVVKITRDLAAAGYGEHAWEAPIDDIGADVVIDNCGSVADLERAASEIVARLVVAGAPEVKCTLGGSCG